MNRVVRLVCWALFVAPPIHGVRGSIVVVPEKVDLGIIRVGQAPECKVVLENHG